jgi:hypothetical protein
MLMMSSLVVALMIYDAGRHQSVVMIGDGANVAMGI